MTLLKTVDDACDFIADWCQEKGNHAGPPLRTDFAVPECIVRLNARVGDLWHSAKRQPPAFDYARPFLGVLGGQDEIVSPGKYARDEDGFVPFIKENQGVWQFGFDPDDVDQLLVKGDCIFGPRGAAGYDWDLVDATPEDALVCTLLINLCLQSVANWDDNVPKPEAAHRILWQHPAWSGFDGFWINDERTLIYFSGWRVTRK